MSNSAVHIKDISIHNIKMCILWSMAKEGWALLGRGEETQLLWRCLLCLCVISVVWPLEILRSLWVTMSQSVSCENTLLLSVLRQACANTQPHSYTQTVGLRLSLRGSNRASPLRALFKGLSCTVQRSFRHLFCSQRVFSISLSLLLSARVSPEGMISVLSLFECWMQHAYTNC